MNENNSFPYFLENQNPTHPKNGFHLEEKSNNISEDEPRDLPYLPPAVLTRKVAANTRIAITNSVINLVSKATEGIRQNAISEYLTLPARSIYTRSWLGPFQCDLYKDTDSSHDLSPVREDGDSFLKNKNVNDKENVNYEKAAEVTYFPSRNDFMDEKHYGADFTAENVLDKEKDIAMNLSDVYVSINEKAVFVLEDIPDKDVLVNDEDPVANFPAKNDLKDTKQVIENKEDISIKENVSFLFKPKEDDEVGLNSNSDLMNEMDVLKYCLAKDFLRDELESFTDRTTQDIMMDENSSMTEMFGDACLENQTVSLANLTVVDIRLNEKDTLVQSSPKKTYVNIPEAEIDATFDELNSSNKKNETVYFSVNSLTNKREGVADELMVHDHPLVNFSTEDFLLNEKVQEEDFRVPDITKHEVKSEASFSGEKILQEKYILTAVQSEITLINKNDPMTSSPFEDIIEDIAAKQLILVDVEDPGTNSSTKSILIYDNKPEELADTDISLRKIYNEDFNVEHFLINEEDSINNFSDKDVLTNENVIEDDTASEFISMNEVDLSTSSSTKHVLVNEEVLISSTSGEDVLSNRIYVENVNSEHMSMNEEDRRLNSSNKNVLIYDNKSADDTATECIFTNEVDPSTSISIKNILENEELPTSSSSAEDLLLKTRYMENDPTKHILMNEEDSISNTSVLDVLINVNEFEENAASKFILMKEVDTRISISTKNILTTEKEPGSSFSAEDILSNKIYIKNVHSEDMLEDPRTTDNTAAECMFTNEVDPSTIISTTDILGNKVVPAFSSSAEDAFLKTRYMENDPLKHFLMNKEDSITNSSVLDVLINENIIEDNTASEYILMNEDDPSISTPTKYVLINEEVRVLSTSAEDILLNSLYIENIPSDHILMNDEDRSSNSQLKDVLINDHEFEENAASEYILMNEVYPSTSISTTYILGNKIGPASSSSAEDVLLKNMYIKNDPSKHILLNEKDSVTNFLVNDVFIKENILEDNTASEFILMNEGDPSTSNFTRQLLINEDVPVSSTSAEDILLNSLYIDNVPSDHILTNDEDRSSNPLHKYVLINDSEFEENAASDYTLMNEVDPSISSSTKHVLIHEEVQVSSTSAEDVLLDKIHIEKVPSEHVLINNEDRSSNTQLKDLLINDNGFEENAAPKYILTNEVDPSTKISSTKQVVPVSSTIAEDVLLNKIHIEKVPSEHILISTEDSSSKFLVKDVLKNNNDIEDYRSSGCMSSNDEEQVASFSADNTLNKIYTAEDFADKYILMFEVDPIVELSGNILPLKEKDIVADFTAKYSTLMNNEDQVTTCSTRDILMKEKYKVQDCKAKHRKSTEIDLSAIDILINAEDPLATGDDLTFTKEELACLEEVIAFWSNDDTISSTSEDFSSRSDELLSFSEVNTLPECTTLLVTPHINVDNLERDAGEEHRMVSLNYSFDKNEPLIELSDYYRDIARFQQHYVGVISESDT